MLLIRYKVNRFWSVNIIIIKLSNRHYYESIDGVYIIAISVSNEWWSLQDFVYICCCCYWKITGTNERLMSCRKFVISTFDEPLNQHELDKACYVEYICLDLQLIYWSTNE